MITPAPTRWGRAASARSTSALDAALARTDIAAIAITGKPFILAAGADLSAFAKITKREQGLAIARIGHAVFDKLHSSPVPDIRVHQRPGARRRAGDHAALPLPDGVGRRRRVSLYPKCHSACSRPGAVLYLLPNLIGADRAVQVIIENALNQNRMMTAAQVARTWPRRRHLRRRRFPGSLTGLGRLSSCAGR